MSTPESLARENIDKQLTSCGWMVQSRNAMNLYAARGVAVREFPLDGGPSTTLRADYLLFVDRKAVGCLRLENWTKVRLICKECADGFYYERKMV